VSVKQRGFMLRCEDCGGALKPASNAEITAAAAGIGFYENCLRATAGRSGIMSCSNCGRLVLSPRHETAHKKDAITADEAAFEDNHSTAL
jgi:hypothetical protein